jgi:hypothetical protein
MVEAVKSLSQIQNIPAYNLPLGAISVGNAGQDVLFNQGLGSPLSGYGSAINDLSSLDMDGMNLSMYGPIALNQRIFKTYQQDMRQSSFACENQNITTEDQNNLQSLAGRIDEYRDPVLGIRLLDREQVTEELEGWKQYDKGVALYLTNCAKDGLKDPNQQVSFENLKNPLRAVNTLKTKFSLTTPEANENIDLLSDIAVKGRSPEMAASLLEATSKGGVTSIGVDSKTAQKLLIESRSKFDNEGDYYNYVTSVDKAYKKLFPGKSLDKYINDNYKPALQKAAPVSGIAVGATIGAVVGFGLPGAAIGALVGGLVGLATYSSNWFGRSNEGEKLRSTVDKARKIDYDNDNQRYNFGDLSGSMLGSSLPPLGLNSI